MSLQFDVSDAEIFSDAASDTVEPAESPSFAPESPFAELDGLRCRVRELLHQKAVLAAFQQAYSLLLSSSFLALTFCAATARTHSCRRCRLRTVVFTVTRSP